MKRLSTEEKIALVKFYWSSQSIVTTQRQFRAHFKTKFTPCGKTILRLQEKFLRDGTVLNQHKGNSGRPNSKRTPETISKVKSVICKDPKKSVRKVAQEVGTSHSTVRRILRKDLELFPYKMSVHHKLSDIDKQQRIVFADWLKKKIAYDPGFLEGVWFNDEAHFHLTGQVNTQNCRIWASSLPDTVLEEPLHSPKVTVWCAMSATGIIGPFFFEDRSGCVQTVNKERYVDMLERFWKAVEEDSESEAGQIWFQQDGATPHTSKMALRWLEERLGERVISRGTDTPWPPHSPDLSPLYFYLWGFLKSRVYAGDPKTLVELKRAIRRAVHAIPPATCARVIGQMAKRVDVCLRRKGSHLENVL